MDASYFQGEGGDAIPLGGGGGDALLSPLPPSPIPHHSPARGVVRPAFDRISDKVSLMLARNGGGGAQPQQPQSAVVPGEGLVVVELHPPTGARGSAVVGGFFQRLRHRLMRQQQQQVDLPGMNLAGEPASAMAVGGGAAAGWCSRERSLSQRQALELHRQRGDTLSLDLGAGMNEDV